MKIAFFEIENREQDNLIGRFMAHEVEFFEWPLNKRSVVLAKDAEIISVFIYSRIDKKILKDLPNLKLIVTRSTGFDHIDIKECKKRGIKVCNVPNYGENTVAEHTFALLLDLSRNVHKAFVRIVRDDFSIDKLEGFDLKEKTIGVIGTGKIGSSVIRIANGFQMKTIAYDKFPNKILTKKLRFAYVPLNKLLSESDIITLHVPLSDSTYHLINKKTIKLMRKGVIILNTSRGEIVDTKALLNAIKSGHVAGAGLDVIEGEELLKEEKAHLHHPPHLRGKKLKKVIQTHSLLHNDRVIFTPHIAFYSKEALERILSTTIDNIQSFIKNKPINVVK